MREISTKPIEDGEHVMIDGVEYVAVKHGYNCDGCAFQGSVCDYIPCENYIMVKAEDTDTLMTNQQLSEWLAKGHGQAKFSDSRVIFSGFSFDEGEEDEAVNEDFLIRPWGTDEWVKPTVEIYRRDCRK